MYETAAVLATEKCSLGAKIRKMSLQAYDSRAMAGAVERRLLLSALANLYSVRHSGRTAVARAPAAQ